LEYASRYRTRRRIPQKENNMFRITTLALAAATVIGAAALAPTTASASHQGWHRSGNDGWHRSGWNNNWRHRDRARSGFTIRIGTPYAYAPRCYTSRRWVDTRWGWRLRTVRTCR
jgi:hypothetical protein